MYQTLSDSSLILLAGVLFTFGLTIFLMKKLADKLPHDQGRAFAVEGALSKGKVRGDGVIMIPVFILADLIFNSFSVQKLIYLVIIFLCMLTGFFDDASEKPWNEYLKGTLDFVLAIMTAVCYLYFNGNSFMIGNMTVTIPYVVFAILIVVLVWTAINVTNCTDGVDGLSSTLSIITLGSFLIFIRRTEEIGGFNYTIILYIAILLAYLWYNSTPCTMMMGDAGSRAMGMMIAITALMSKHPLLYIPFSFVIIADGGLGLIKVSVIRFLKIKNFLKNLRCPLHDHARKVKEWSNTQVDYRFAIIQVLISVITLFFMMNIVG